MVENLNKVNTRLVGIKGFYSAEVKEATVLSAMRDIIKELKFTVSDEIEVCANAEVSDVILATISLGAMSPEKDVKHSTWINAIKLPKICEKMLALGFSCSFVKVQDNVLKVGFVTPLTDFDYVD
jgi:hypothetical protein